MTFDLKTLRKFYLHWRSEKAKEVVGEKVDLSFMDQGAWLKDSAVIDRIDKVKNGWAVKLVFAHPTEINTFLMKTIRVSPTLEKARLTATLMRKTAAKDPRGTTTLSPTIFKIFEN